MPEPGEAGGIPFPSGRSVEEGGDSPQNNSGSVITMGLSTRSPSLGSDGGSDGEIIIRVGYGTAFSSHNLGKEVREELLQEFKKHLNHGTAKEFEDAFFGLDSGSVAEATQELRLGVRGQIRGLHERGVKDRAKERDRSSAGSTRAPDFKHVPKM